MHLGVVLILESVHINILKTRILLADLDGHLISINCDRSLYYSRFCIPVIKADM